MPTPKPKRDRKKENAERKSPAALQRGVDREVKLDTDELDDLLSRFDGALGKEQLPTAVDLGRARTSAERARVMRQLSADASALASRLPDPAAWAKFFRSRIRPTFNAVFTKVKMCIECGRRFPSNKKSDISCSDECTSRRNNRGVKRATAQQKVDRSGLRIKKHLEGCRACRAQPPCAKFKKLMAEDVRLKKALDALQPDEWLGAPQESDDVA